MIDDVISYSIWRHLCKKYLLTRSSWIFDVPHYCVHCNHIIYHTEVYEETFNVNNTELSLQLNGKLWWISRRFRALIWRAGDTVQNLESPGLSGRVDSTVVHIRNPKVLPGETNITIFTISMGTWSRTCWLHEQLMMLWAKFIQGCCLKGTQWPEAPTITFPCGWLNF